MSTTANVLEAFQACLPRRGRKAADDRLFLEAMHLLTVEVDTNEDEVFLENRS